MADTVVQVLMQVAMQISATLTMPVFWLMAVLLAIQMWQVQKKNQKQVAVRLPAFLFDWLERWSFTLFAGILGGIIASMLFLLTGISCSASAMLCLWVIMIVLYLIQRRFFCFAYAGGLFILLQCSLECLGVAVFDFDGASILALVAVLHFTEAVLVRLSGTLQKVTVYLRNKQGKTTVMTQLQMSWLIPLAMPVPIAYSESIILQSGCIVMPLWWPLFGTAETVVLYHLIPTLAVIGYSDSVNSGEELHQTKKVSGLLCVYSILLYLMVWASTFVSAMLPIAALAAILGHEWILWQGSASMRKYIHRKKNRNMQNLS